MIITEKFKSGREFAEKYAGSNLKFVFSHPIYKCTYEGVVFGFRGGSLNETAAMVVLSKPDGRQLKLYDYDQSSITFLKRVARPYDTVFSYYPNPNDPSLEIILNMKPQLEYIKGLRERALKAGIK